MINVLYCCAFRHRPTYPGINLSTVDILPKCYCSYTLDVRDVLKESTVINLSDYFAFIFTPPCNYYSRANWRRNQSKYANDTKDLLPLVLQWCNNQHKYYLVENVMNKTLLSDLLPSKQFVIAGHTYWSNLLTYDDVKDLPFVKQNKQYVSGAKRDGNTNVDLVIRKFLQKLWFLTHFGF